MVHEELAMMRLNIPDIDEQELEEVRKVLQSGYLTQGPKVEEFERAVAVYTGCKHAFAMSSCTTALHLALVCLGIDKGDEVLVSDFTFPATGNVIVQQGAIPVLVDINLDTFTVDPNDFQKKITKRTRGAIVVDTFGCSVDMDAIRSITDGQEIPVIEDAACAIGTTYKGRYCGSLSTIGCFSFHPRKVITTGEGGMITTDNDKIAGRIRLLRSHGGIRTGVWFSYEEAGYNYRMSDINGAIGVAQMKKLPDLIARKRILAEGLRERISKIPGIKVPTEPPWGGHIYQSFVILLDPGLDRDRIVQALREVGIEATLGTYAMHDQPIYQRLFGYRQGQLPNSHAAFVRAITLPLYPSMSEKDLDLISEKLHLVLS